MERKTYSAGTLVVTVFENGDLRLENDGGDLITDGDDETKAMLHACLYALGHVAAAPATPH